MRLTLKLLGLAALLIVTAGVGFYMGLKNGSYTMSALAVQNEVYSSLSRIDASVKALEKNDYNYSLEQHQRNLSAALFDLGSYAPTVPYWNCKDRDQAVIKNANAYLDSHQGLKSLPPEPLLGEALKFCQ